MDYTKIPAGRNPPLDVWCVVEIPKGSSNKYEFDHDLHVMRLDRPLFSPMYYPGDYGFIPSTLASDGDPLDILVLMQEASFSGCLIATRPLGVLVMEDEKGVDEKILAVPVSDPSYETYRTLSDIPPHFLRAMDHFFQIYKELEGKSVRTMGWQDRWVAEKIIIGCIEAAKKKS